MKQSSSSSAASQRNIAVKESANGLWRVKAKTDEEILSSIEDVETDTILTCDCTCKECKVLYKSYIEAKVSNNVLTESLSDEKRAMVETIDQIKELEKAYGAQLSDSARALATAQLKIDELNKELLLERALRMEEIYRIDFQTKECAESLKELETYKKLANRLTIESKSYEFEKQQIQHKLTKMTDAYNEAMRQVKKYESEVFHMEEKLDHFRIRVDSSDSNVNQLKLRNENLMARLNPNYKLKSVGSRHLSGSSVDDRGGSSMDIEAILNRDYGGREGPPPPAAVPLAGRYANSVNSTGGSGSSSAAKGLTLSDIAATYNHNSVSSSGGSGLSQYAAPQQQQHQQQRLQSHHSGSSAYSLDHLYSGVVNASGFKYRPEAEEEEQEERVTLMAVDRRSNKGRKTNNHMGGSSSSSIGISSSSVRSVGYGGRRSVASLLPIK